VSTEPGAAHQPILSIWKNNLVSDWFRKISFTKYLPLRDSAIISAEASRMRPLIQEDNVVGIAALNVETDNHFSNVTTVGGFAASVSARHASGVIGFLDHHAGSAKREPSNLTAFNSTVQNWANDQIDLLEQLGIDPVRWCIATCSLVELDVDPSKILRAAFVHQNSFEVLKLEEIFGYLRTAPIALFKSGFMFHIDHYVGSRGHQDFLTFVSLKNSKFLSLNGIDPTAPRDSGKNSFFDCLNRYCALRGQKLIWQITKHAAPSQIGGTADAVLLSLQESQ
jgi:hypothetical protein